MILLTPNIWIVVCILWVRKQHTHIWLLSSALQPSLTDELQHMEKYIV